LVLLPQPGTKQLGNFPPHPKFAKSCLVVRHNKLQPFCPPPKIAAGCGHGRI